MESYKWLVDQQFKSAQRERRIKAASEDIQEWFGDIKMAAEAAREYDYNSHIERWQRYVGPAGWATVIRRDAQFILDIIYNLNQEMEDEEGGS